MRAAQENVQGSVRVDKLRGSRIFHGAGNTSQRGLMEYPINTCARPIQCRRIPNVPFNEFEVPMDFPAPAAQFLEVLPLTRTEVIKDADRITPLQQARHYMASDEAASPCNQYQSTAAFGTHACSSLHYASLIPICCRTSKVADRQRRRQIITRLKAH